MDNPHNRFGELISEVMRMHKAFAQGRTIECNRDEEIMKVLPHTTGAFKDDLFPRSPKAFYWMVLAYYVVLLEAMLKDYVLHFACGGRHLSRRPDYTREEDIFTNLRDQIEDERLLPDKEWERFVMSRVDDIEITEFPCDVEKCEVDDARRKISDSASAFPYRRILLKSVIIRNLIIHNDGRMNKRNHKRAPFCEVGEEPDVGVALIYNTGDALYMLNDHVASPARE